MNWSKILSNKNIQICQEYCKRIVKELLEEYSNQGIALEHYKEVLDELEGSKIRFKNIVMLYTRWTGEIAIPTHVVINEWTNEIMSGHYKFHQPKLNYEKYAGEVKSHFRNVIKEYIELEKEIKEKQIMKRLEDLERDFENE